MAGHLPRPDYLDERRVRSPERRHRSPTHRHRSPAQQHQRQHRPADWQYSCGLCQEDHPLKTCRRFLHLSPHRRYETVERRGYCRNCLARSHLAPDCPSLIGCRRCDQRHHTELHGAPQLKERPQIAIIETPCFKWTTTFVPTATIRVSGDDFETWKSLRAIVSQSAAVSKIAGSTFRRLGLRSFQYRGQKFTSFKIKARNQRRNWVLRVTALITDDLPRRPYSDPMIDDPTVDLPPESLADTDPRSNTPIDIELAADTHSSIVLDGSISTGVGEVKAFNSTLGYILSGLIRSPF